MSTRTPRAPEARRRAVEWTSYVGSMCRDMRAGKELTGRHAAVARALDAYMRHQALRAPTPPRDHGFLNPESLVLWRGMARMPAPAPGDVLPAKCFNAFTYIRRVAQGFAFQGFLIKLTAGDIARGTPWIWFWTSRAANARAPNMVPSEHMQEHEVLLPPGVFQVHKVTRGQDGVPVVRVSFAPYPQYLRKGQLPDTSRRGALGVELVSGEHVRFYDPNFGARVRERVARVAAAAAARAPRSR